MLLVSVPRLTIDVPPLSIAALKSCVVNAGYTAKCQDMNISLYHHLTFEEWLEIDDYFQTDLRYTNSTEDGAGTRDIDFTTMHQTRLGGLSVREKYLDFLRNYAIDVLKQKPRWLGVSVFSVNSILATIDFCSLIKELNPHQKIILGGCGVSSFGIASKSNFGTFMLDRGLADKYIAGEGEYAITELLDTDDTLHTHQPQIDDLDALPYGDYSDFDFSKYPGTNNLIYLTGSRGCIRSCTFCDINSLWAKFRFRTGKSLAGEIMNAHEKYGSTEFYFTDSLINGNVRELRELCKYLIELKEQGKLPQHSHFGGQWIARPKNQTPDDFFDLCSRAGLYNISIGVESGSDKVLQDMQKGVTRVDMDYTMEMLSKYGIRANMLMLVGYPTETEEDFQNTLNMFTDYQIYSDAGIIWGVNLGKTMVILPGAPIGKTPPEEWGMSFDKDGNWVMGDNDYNTRVTRRIRAQYHCENLGYVVKSTVVNINSLHQIMNKGGYDSLG